MSKKTRPFKSNSKSMNLFDLRKARRANAVNEAHRIVSAYGENISPSDLSHIETQLSKIANLDSSFISSMLEKLKDKFNQSCVVMNDDGHTVDYVAQNEAAQATACTALNNAYAENLAGTKNHQLTRSWFFHSVKKSWRKVVGDLKSEGKSFFSNVNDFAQKVPVRGASIITKYRASVVNVEKSIRSIFHRAPTARVKILSNKCTRRLQVAATVSFAALLMACSNGNKQSPVEQPSARDTFKLPNGVFSSSDVVDGSTNSANVSKQTYVVPVDSTRVHPKDLESTINFLNNTFKNKQINGKDVSGYEYATYCLTNEIMEKHFPNRTRDEVLNEYRYVRSFYPNATEAERLNVSAERVKAAYVAQALDEFFCDETQLPNNCSDLFISLDKGYKQKYAIGIQNPCGDAKVLYTGRQHAAKKVAKVKHQASTTVRQAKVEEAAVPVVEQVATVEDSIVAEKPQTSFEEASSSLHVDTAYVQTVTSDPIVVQEFKSNERLASPKITGVATAEQVLDLKAQNTKVMVENPQTDFVDVDTISSTASAGKGLIQSSNVIDNQQTDFVDANKFDTADDIDTFVPVDEDTLDTNKIQYSYSASTKVKTDSINAANSSQASDSVVADQSVYTDSVTVKILADSDTISVGTPGAGYVAERGGVENRGLSKKDIDYARKKLGDDTYEKIVAEAPKVWFAKGGIAEGLTPDQFAYIAAVLAVTEPHGVAVTAIMKSINCGDTITSESVVKAAVDGVHKNKTRDGWTYSKRIYVDRVHNNGCDEKLTLKQWRTRKQRPTSASGPKFDRYFEQRGVIPRQTAFVEVPSSLTINYQYVQNVQVQDPDITAFRSNEDLMQRDTGVATAKQVLDLKAKNTKVMVENAAPTVSAKKKGNQAKKLDQVNKAYQEAAKKNGLSGNLSIDKYSDDGSEFIANFFKGRKITAKELDDYQSTLQQAVTKALAVRNRRS